MLRPTTLVVIGDFGKKENDLDVEVMSNPPASQAKWDPWKMFDISEKEIDLIKRRQALLSENKAKFRELVQDPKASGRGGWILDPAVQRWYTARATRRSYFAPDARSGVIFMCLVILPIVGMSYYGIRNKVKQEKEFRAGKVKILDRWTKFHY